MKENAVQRFDFEHADLAKRRANEIEEGDDSVYCFAADDYNGFLYGEYPEQRVYPERYIY
jgi:hypothetical protein